MIRDRGSLLTALMMLSMSPMPYERGPYEEYMPRRPIPKPVRSPAEKEADEEKQFKAEQKRQRKNAKRAALAAAQGEKPCP